MTLRFVDSFDHYAAGDLTEKWTANTGAPTLPSNGRRSTKCLSSTGATFTKTLDAQATWIVGFAFRLANLPSSTQSLIALLDAGTIQTDVRLNQDGTLSVTRNGTVLGTSAFALSVGNYVYLEFKCFIHDTTGTYEVRVNGSNKVSGSSADTKNTANATANQVKLGSAGLSWDADDLYICDGAGSSNNNFLGDCRVDYYAPNGAGNSTQLTRGGADSGANWSQVDETPPNDDTDYNQSSNVGDIDLYDVTDMTHTPSSIFGVQLNLNAKKDDAGTRSIAGVVRSGGTNYEGGTQALSTSYVYYLEVRETDPDTSAAWTKTGVNNAQFGVKVAA
ncbi:MAG: hypothetical protein ACREK4_00130 [Candidatus Rokuibacteriota bacterium]